MNFKLLALAILINLGISGSAFAKCNGEDEGLYASQISAQGSSTIECSNDLTDKELDFASDCLSGEGDYHDYDESTSCGTSATGTAYCCKYGSGPPISGD